MILNSKLAEKIRDELLKKDKKVAEEVSTKVTLRERIAQTGYWKIKLACDEATKHIKVYFVTPDEDGTLTIFIHFLSF